MLSTYPGKIVFKTYLASRKQIVLIYFDDWNIIRYIVLRCTFLMKITPNLLSRATLKAPNTVHDIDFSNFEKSFLPNQELPNELRAKISFRRQEEPTLAQQNVPEVAFLGFCRIVECVVSEMSVSLCTQHIFDDQDTARCWCWDVS